MRAALAMLISLLMLLSASVAEAAAPSNDSYAAPKFLAGPLPLSTTGSN